MSGNAVRLQAIIGVEAYEPSGSQHGVEHRCVAGGFGAPIADLASGLAKLRTALSDHSAESVLDEARHAQEKLQPAMAEIRAAADILEGVVADDLWPLPTYQEMLYIL